MDLKEIKKKFRNKARADLKDLDLVLNAIPFLVREIERLETELKNDEKRISHLVSQIKQRPPLSHKGKKGEAEWETRVDEEKNRLYIRLAGTFDYNSAKTATNHVIAILPNIRENFDIIINIIKMEAGYSKKVLFHLDKLIYSLKKIGINRIIRIVDPEKTELRGVFDGKSNIGELKIFNVNTEHEAESVLENLTHFLKT